MHVQIIALGMFVSPNPGIEPLRVDLEPLCHVRTVEALDFQGPLPIDAVFPRGLQSISFEMSYEEIDLELFLPCPNLISLKLSEPQLRLGPKSFEFCTVKGLGKLQKLRTFCLEQQGRGVRIFIDKGMRKLRKFVIRCEGRALFPGVKGGLDELLEGIERFRLDYIDYARDDEKKIGIRRVLAAAKRQGIGLTISGGQFVHNHAVLGAGTHVRYFHQT